jgi:hypothetical protein
MDRRLSRIAAIDAIELITAALAGGCLWGIGVMPL